MNVAISTFARRGHLLAAFAVAVLLAASSGTAWAQTTPTRNVGLTMGVSSSTLEEGASMAASTPNRVTVTIRRTTEPTYDPTPGDSESTDDNRTPVFNDGQTLPLKLTATCNGESDLAECSFSVRVKGAEADLAGLGTDGGATLNFADPDTTEENSPLEKTIELLVSDERDEGDWNNETVVLTLEFPPATVGETRYTARSQTSTLTITDDDPAPKLTFAPPSIQLAKGNMQTMTVGVDIGGTSSAKAGIRTKLNSLNGGNTRGGSSDEILLSVSPPDAVGSLIKIYKGDTEPSQGTDLLTDRQGRYIVGPIGDDGSTDGAVAATEGSGDGIALNVKAIDVSGFRDEQITFTVMDGRTEAQKTGDGGGIEDANPATVTILSGEETPTVTFSTEAIDIDEGDSETVHLLADTDQGSEVGSATVRVTGDALISLSQGGSSISGGTVSFDGSANAELTITALMDRQLEDGEEKTATVTITDASGASIGDPRALTVTVVGATAVPALPLIGQLLLALFLMAGGTRLYRRRQK